MNNCKYDIALLCSRDNEEYFFHTSPRTILNENSKPIEYHFHAIDIHANTYKVSELRKYIVKFIIVESFEELVKYANELYSSRLHLKINNQIKFLNVTKKRDLIVAIVPREMGDGVENRTKIFEQGVDVILYKDEYDIETIKDTIQDFVTPL